jgi:hypothetical protein
MSARVQTADVLLCILMGSIDDAHHNNLAVEAEPVDLTGVTRASL